ncbi:helix-turn-helix domain-containing protein [Paenibacillus sp. MY03]|uniref:AraC family transcriptional regulator n=1 Tax=Paenibacillus sp. MY03 TaxID=302980 RepID=UPI0015C5AC00|nr:helix-turn-helix domain-containing protein [Paenibacillus sp. MY03]
MSARTDFIFQAWHEAGTSVSMHRHRCYEIVYYRQGRGSTRIGRAEYVYEPGSYAVVPPDTLHDEIRREATEVLCAGFRLIDSEFPSSVREGLYNDDDDCTIGKLLLAMQHEITAKPPLYAIRLNLCISELLVAHFRLWGVAERDKQDRPLYFARNYMDEHYQERIDIASLARMSGYSYDRFRHLFKLAYGVSPLNYVLERRIDLAKKQLEQTEVTVSSIAAGCGFSTTAQFCTLFKREAGLSPLIYRKISRMADFKSSEHASMSSRPVDGGDAL